VAERLTGGACLHAGGLGRAKELAEDGKIDPLSSVADDKVYLFSGNADQTVARAVVEAAKGFYAAAGVPHASVTLVEKEGGHAFLTETEGTACGRSEAPFISDCDYDQAKAILDWIYGPVTPPAPSPTGQYLVFDQSDFDKSPPDGLAPEGVVYVPTECAAHAGCRLHIALMAAIRPARRSATPSSRRADLPASPTPTGW
jgi:hypothetical protein